MLYKNKLKKIGENVLNNYFANVNDDNMQVFN